LRYTYSEILVEKCRFGRIPPLFGAPVGVIWLEYEIFGVGKLESLGAWLSYGVVATDLLALAVVATDIGVGVKSPQNVS